MSTKAPCQGHSSQHGFPAGERWHYRTTSLKRAVKASPISLWILSLSYLLGGHVITNINWAHFPFSNLKNFAITIYLYKHFIVQFQFLVCEWGDLLFWLPDPCDYDLVLPEGYSPGLTSLRMRVYFKPKDCKLSAITINWLLLLTQ